MDNQLISSNVETNGSIIDFKMVAEKVPAMLWLSNSAGEFIFSNGIHIKSTGRENSQKMGGELWFKALHPDDKNECLRIFNEAFQTHKSFEMEYRLEGEDGEYRNILDRGEPYLNQESEFSGFIGSSIDITELKLPEEKLKRSHQQLMQFNQEMSLINKLNARLQACHALPDIYSLVSHDLEHIFSEWAGAIYLFNENKNLVELIASWGSEKIQSSDVVKTHECWALRQSKAHNAMDISNRLLCNHINEQIGSYACISIMAQGEMLGILHMEYVGETQFESGVEKERYFDSRQHLMQTAADNLAHSIVGLELRDALNRQSIRDPLTFLFNRPYMEESLSREVARCERLEEGIGVILVSIDDFKLIHDNFGRDASDVVLVEFSKFLTEYFRQSDLVCRFEGEEFIIILPSAPQSLVVERATQLCYKLHDVNIQYEGKKLPPITASFGVAYLPGNDFSQSANIIKLADEALYKAKKAGRDQVVVYETN